MRPPLKSEGDSWALTRKLRPSIRIVISWSQITSTTWRHRRIIKLRRIVRTRRWAMVTKMPTWFLTFSMTNSSHKSGWKFTVSTEHCKIVLEFYSKISQQSLQRNSSSCASTQSSHIWRESHLESLKPQCTFIGMYSFKHVDLCNLPFGILMRALFINMFASISFFLCLLLNLIRCSQVNVTAGDAHVIILMENHYTVKYDDDGHAFNLINLLFY